MTNYWFCECGFVSKKGLACYVCGSLAPTTEKTFESFFNPKSKIVPAAQRKPFQPVKIINAEVKALRKKGYSVLVVNKNEICETVVTIETLKNQYDFIAIDELTELSTENYEKLNQLITTRKRDYLAQTENAVKKLNNI